MCRTGLAKFLTNETTFAEPGFHVLLSLERTRAIFCKEGAKRNVSTEGARKGHLDRLKLAYVIVDLGQNVALVVKFQTCPDVQN